MRPFALATAPSRTSKSPLNRIRSPPSMEFPRAKANPAAMLTTKPIKVKLFGERGMLRASGVIRFLILFLSSLKILSPPFASAALHRQSCDEFKSVKCPFCSLALKQIGLF